MEQAELLSRGERVTAPNIFELIARDALQSGLRDAIKYLLYQLRRHQYLGSFYERQADEIQLLVDGIIQYTHLRTYQASFAEHFYNLRRISTETNERSVFGELSRRQLWGSMIGLALVPYMKSKLDAWYERLHYKNDKTKREQQVMRVYRLLNSTNSVIKLVMFTRYTVGRTMHHDLLMKLASTRLCSTSQIPIEQSALLEQINTATWSSRLVHLIAQSLGKCLTGGAFYIQFLDYWHSRSSGMPEFSPLPYPSAPSKELLPYSLSSDAARCPICHNNRSQDCALATSGYVFCYKCIYEHVKTKKTCPITGYPSSEASLIRLYPPSGAV